MDCLFILFEYFNFRLATGSGLYKFPFPSAGHDSPDWVMTNLPEPGLKDSTYQ